MTTLYVAIDPNSSLNFEFVTDDFDALSEWLDEDDARFYEETSLSNAEEIQEEY